MIAKADAVDEDKAEVQPQTPHCSARNARADQSAMISRVRSAVQANCRDRILSRSLICLQRSAHGLQEQKYATVAAMAMTHSQDFRP